MSAPATVHRGLPAARAARLGCRATVVDAGVGNLGNLARALGHLGAAVEVTREPRQVAAARCLILPGVGAFAPPREALRGPLEAALREALAEGAWLLGICVGFQLLFEAGEEFGVTDGLALLPGRVTRLPAGVPVPHIGWNRLHGLAAHPLLAGLAGGGQGGGEPAASGLPATGFPGSGLQPSGLQPSEPPATGIPATEAPTIEIPVGRGVDGSIESAAPPACAGGPAVPGCSAGESEGGRGPYVYFVHSYAPEGVPDEVCLALATHGRGFAAVAGRGRVLGTQFHPERSGAPGLRLLANFLEIADGTAAGH